MNAHEYEYRFLLSERTTLRDLIDQAPPGSIITKMSLENRLRKVEEELKTYEGPQPHIVNPRLTSRGKSVMSEINKLHRRAMDLTALAFIERTRGNTEKASELFEQALENEVAAIGALDEYVEPTYSVLHRSAATLALDCNQYHKAEKLVAKALAKEPPAEIAEELRDVLKQANSQLHR